jgi:hypothetical protein
MNADTSTHDGTANAPMPISRLPIYKYSKCIHKVQSGQTYQKVSETEHVKMKFDPTDNTWRIDGVAEPFNPEEEVSIVYIESAIRVVYVAQHDKTAWLRYYMVWAAIAMLVVSVGLWRSDPENLQRHTLVFLSVVVMVMEGMIFLAFNRKVRSIDKLPTLSRLLALCVCNVVYFNIVLRQLSQLP